MKKIIPLSGLTLLLVLLMTGCLTAVHPLFTEKELISEPRLLGNWRIGEGADAIEVNFEKGNPESFKELPEVLQKASSRAYIVMVKEKGQIVQKFFAFPTQLGDALYLDYFATTTPRQNSYDAFYKAHYNAMHSFYKIQFEKNGSFKASRLKGEYLENLIKNKQLRIRHEERADGSFVITAPTAELQQYVLKYGNNKEAYENSETYSKIN